MCSMWLCREGCGWMAPLLLRYIKDGMCCVRSPFSTVTPASARDCAEYKWPVPWQCVCMESIHEVWGMSATNLDAQWHSCCYNAASCQRITFLNAQHMHSQQTPRLLWYFALQNSTKYWNIMGDAWHCVWTKLQCSSSRSSNCYLWLHSLVTLQHCSEMWCFRFVGI